VQQLKLGLATLVVLATTACVPSAAVPASPPGGPSGASGSPTGFRPSGPPDGSAPHEAENNSWKERHDLTAQERREGKALAARIRPALSALRSDGSITPEATETALVGLGLEPENVSTEAFRPRGDSETPPPGSEFAVKFGGAGCVIGSVAPDRLDLEVTGAAAEFGCLEPFSH
jgi:hypothetical protein